eukprot:jgi/Mesen1/8902/ME000537S08301
MSSVGRDYGRDSVVDVLSLAWHRLRLSVRAPSRCPSWDAIILTAASPTQALLYTTQLEAAKANGRIAEGTLVLAVPDPDGRRIGSGGATLGALRALSSLLASMPEEVEEGKQGQEHEGEGEEEKEEEVEEEEDLLLAVEERANEQQQKPQQQQQEEEQQQQQEQQEQQQEQQAEQQQLQPQREPGGPARQEGKEGARAARSRRSRSSSSSSSGGGGSSSSCRRSSSSRRRRAAFRALEGMRVLLVHAGGDSKRVPWANPMGKPFVPLPLLADEDPDGPAPSLFDHILAIAAPAVDAIGHGGGMLIMTGDVLPCFNASRLTIPPDAACVVTVPTPLDVATRHGVVLTTGATVPPGATAALISAEERLQSQLAASADPAQQEQAQEQEEQPQSKPQPPAGVDSARVNGGSTPVVDLLQKPSVQEMVDRGAIVGSGAALLDTGIFAARGATWRDLIGMAVADPDPVVALMKTGEEMSLYEELAGSWVPARHAWLRGRPLGRQLIASLGKSALYTHIAGITIRDDAGGVCHISNPAPLLGQLSAQEDSFCLAKAALLVTGFARDARLWGSPEGDATSAAPARGGEGGVGADAARLRGSAEGAATSASREEGEGDGDGEEEGGGQGEEAGGREGGGGGPAEAAAGSGQATGGGVCGLEIETWADVPRGSGLGTSSILAAALVKALLQVRKGSLLGLGQEEISSSSTPGQVENSERMPGAAAGSPNPASASVSSLRSGAHSGADTNTGTGGTLTGPSGQPEQHGQPGADPSGVPVSNEEVSQLVLLLEQRMGTGGGWQDQVGGLYPGVKCTTSVPTRPLHLTVSSVPLLPDLLGQLHARLVVVFTGQVRLAWNVLHKVVGRYLQRDARTIAAVLRLTKLAGEGRQALAIGSLDALGRVMSDTWRLHQELDPHCTSPAVEALFARVRHLSAGAKLVGAGGGGFAIILATSKATAVEIRRELAAVGDPVRVYNWRLCDGSS